MARRPTTAPPELEQLARIAAASKERLGRASAPPARVGELLSSAQRTSARRAGIGVDVDLWRAIVGNRIADRAQPGRIKDGVLTVRVSSAVWAQELSFLSDELVKRLQAAGVALRSMRFAVSGARTKLPPAAPKRPPPVRAPLPPDLEARLARIEDPELRAAIADAASLSLATRGSTAPPPSVRGPRSAGPGNAPRGRTGRRRP